MATNVGSVQPPIDALIDDLFARPDGISLALLVQQRGDVVAERYGVQPENIFQPEIEITADTTLTSWSMAKSITHAAVGVLVVDGLIDVDAPAAVPEWAGTAKAEITLLQLLEMRSGLRFVEDYVDDGVSHCLEMLFGESGPSHAAYAAALPLDHPPGTVYNYSSGTTNIIARIIGDTVSGGAGGAPEVRRAAVEQFLGDRLFGPVGMSSAIPMFDAASARRMWMPPPGTSRSSGSCTATTAWRHPGTGSCRRAGRCTHGGSRRSTRRTGASTGGTGGCGRSCPAVWSVTATRGSTS